MRQREWRNEYGGDEKGRRDHQLYESQDILRKFFFFSIDAIID